MTIPNKEIIQAYLDGKEIQYKEPNLTKWRTFSYDHEVINQPSPMLGYGFARAIEWRIKPTQAELDYQRFTHSALLEDGVSSKEAYMQGWIDGNLAGKKELTESKT